MSVLCKKKHFHVNLRLCQVSKDKIQRVYLGGCMFLVVSLACSISVCSLEIV